jgi:hypothetical protein
MANGEKDFATRAFEIIASVVFSTAVNGFVLSADQRAELLEILDPAGRAPSESSDATHARSASSVAATKKTPHRHARRSADDEPQSP